MRTCANVSERRGQNMRKNKLGQEEIVGFAVIIIIVAVILLIFLSFYLRSSNEVEIQSYEASDFIQSVLQYTSDCENGGEFLSVQDLILEQEEECSNGKTAGKVLNETLVEICESSWKVGEDTPVKGYEMRINENDESIFMLNVGNVTQNYRNGFQDFARRGSDYTVFFKVYY